MIQTSIINKKFYQINNIDQTEYSEEAWKRKSILDKYNKLIDDGSSGKVALEVLGISRATLFRWQKRYKQEGLVGLEKRSSCPHKVRQPMWTRKEESRIYRLRRKYPLWGKEKIAVMYRRQYKKQISSSTVGRILKRLMDRGKIKKVSFLCQQKVVRPRQFKGHSKRLKKGMKTS